MNCAHQLAQKGLAFVGAVVFSLGVGALPESRGQETHEPAPLRVETDDVQIRAERSSGVAVDGRTTRRTFRVADIRAPDVGIWFDPAATDSLVIADIATSGPIAQLDFQEGDRILEVNHVKVTRETDFIKLLFATKARDGRVEVLIVRKNKEMVIPVEPALLIEHYAVVRHDPLEQLGLVVDDRYDDRVVVWKVIPRSPAFYGGIKPGDVITRFGDQRVVERKAFGELVHSVQPGTVAVEVNRARRARPIQIEVPREWNVAHYDERQPARADRRIERGERLRRDAVESAEEDVRSRVKVDTDVPSRPDVAPSAPRVPRAGR
ncbi:MAG: PDZ domain-containing protein [Pirellulales bacterium]